MSLDRYLDAKSVSFVRSEALYRDHLGRRVLLDFDGEGVYRVDAETPVELLVDGLPCEVAEGRFEADLIVTARQEGRVRGWVAFGRSEPVSGMSHCVSLPYLGGGWLVEAEGPVEIDGRKRPCPSPSLEWPVPFYAEVRGAGSARVIPFEVPLRRERIDAFGVDDEAALMARGFQVQNISKLSVIDSMFENGEPRCAPVASHLNRAIWTLALPEGVRGLILRKTYDRFHGRQRARVLIDGDPVGWWYEPSEDRTARWGISDFGVPERFVRGKAEVQITVDPPAGVPLWSVSLVEAFGIFD